MTMTMEGMFINGRYIPWPTPYLTRKEYDKAYAHMGFPPEDHDQGEAGDGDSGE